MGSLSLRKAEEEEGEKEGNVLPSLVEQCPQQVQDDKNAVVGSNRSDDQEINDTVMSNKSDDNKEPSKLRYMGDSNEELSVSHIIDNQRQLLLINIQRIKKTIE